MANIVNRMIENGLFTAAELKKVMPAAQKGEPEYRVAIKTGLVAEDVFLALVSSECKLPVVAELPADYAAEAFQNISQLFMYNHNLFPLAIDSRRLTVVVNDPFNAQVINGLQQLFPQQEICFNLAREKNINKWLKQYFSNASDPVSASIESEESSVGFNYDDTEHLKDMASEAPVIKLVNQILTKSVEDGASDIHIEPFQSHLQVRYRIDGILVVQSTSPLAMQQAVASRIKIMAKMDISERRLPQDGRIRTKIAGKDIDIRVSCIPIMYGESIVMRILDRNKIDLSLESLGFPAAQLEKFQELIAKPHGIILVTGPTGSGKTTTLYAALQKLNSPDKKIITIENPVEYELAGVNQVEVNKKIGMDFTDGLRSVVRQDPDVILIGEIRDRETANIAVQSALTGHMVFSTLHTNDAVGAIARLTELGVEDYLLSSALVGVMAQRLVRVLCPECKEAFVPELKLQKKLALPFTPTKEQPVFRPVGCKSCHFSGYRGRIGIFELMPISERIRRLILSSRVASELRDVAVEEGMSLLREDGWRNVEAGQTSIAEILRLT